MQLRGIRVLDTSSLLIPLRAFHDQPVNVYTQRRGLGNVFWLLGGDIRQELHDI